LFLCKLRLHAAITCRHHTTDSAQFSWRTAHSSAVIYRWWRPLVQVLSSSPLFPQVFYKQSRSLGHLSQPGDLLLQVFIFCVVCHESIMY
jgi:hypothetical protein